MSDRQIAALGGAIGGMLFALVFLHFYMKVPVKGQQPLKVKRPPKVAHPL